MMSPIQDLGDAFQDLIANDDTIDWSWPASLAFGLGMAALIAEAPPYLRACAVFHVFRQGTPLLTWVVYDSARG